MISESLTSESWTPPELGELVGGVTAGLVSGDPSFAAGAGNGLDQVVTLLVDAGVVQAQVATVANDLPWACTALGDPVALAELNDRNNLHDGPIAPRRATPPDERYTKQAS